MAGTVDIFGHAVSKPVVYAGAGIGVVGGVLMVRSYRAKKAAATAPATTSATDPNASDPIDPATGIPYSQEGGGSGYGGYNASQYDTLGGMGGYGYMDPNTGQYVYPGTGSNIPTVSTNAEWAQEVSNYFQGNGAGGDYIGSISTAESGHCLNAGQEQLVNNAIAVMGSPPEGWPRGAPHLCGNTGTPGPTSGGGTGTPAKVTVPVVAGKRVNEALSMLQAAGLKGRTSPARNPAHEYDVTSASPRGGSKVSKGSTVTLHIKEIR